MSGHQSTQRRIEIATTIMNRAKGDVHVAEGTDPTARFILDSGEWVDVSHEGDRLTIRSLGQVGETQISIKPFASNTVSVEVSE